MFLFRQITDLIRSKIDLSSTVQMRDVFTTLGLSNNVFQLSPKYTFRKVD